MKAVWLPICAAVLSVLLTELVRRYAIARRLLDVPNQRSSHSTVTPRGGGVAIVVCTLIALPLLVSLEALSARGALALAGAGGLVALIGFLDDHGHVAARWRLLAHFCAAAWALVWLQGVPPLAVFGHAIEPGWVGHLLAALYLVWLLNLYNFMDGIDGIAGVEALCVCVGGALLYVLAGHPAFALVPLLLAGAVLGFLYWNFPPAKIFMGDAGSGFLGVVLGILSLQAGWVSADLFWAWIILLGVFVVDASLTLIWRLFRGEKVYEAHRSHAYQHAARRFQSHLPVTAAVGLVNLGWLLPLALWVGVGGLDEWLGVLVAFVPLVVLATWFRAGRPEDRRHS